MQRQLGQEQELYEQWHEQVGQRDLITSITVECDSICEEEVGRGLNKKRRHFLAY